MPFLKANDILELAMQIEQSGEAFYHAVALKAQTPPVRALFADLAAQEVSHYQTFARLAQAVHAHPLMLPDEWDEYQSYLQSTVQSAFFEGPDQALALAEMVTDEKQAIRMAIGFEKETLLFFYDLHDTVSEADQEVIQKIVTEEKAHIRRLADMVRFL